MLPTAEATLPREYLTEKDFCLRYRISREAAHKLRLDGLDPLPCMKFGRRIIYDAVAVERWAARRAERERKAKAAGR